ncbi:glycosyltransferase family 2 protein [Marinimicrobium sp. ABcell2]|uniref:glycosyltransferase family 2 protein n=1 Tax=Marinimicrobium sp. ABcell2 TaxID=3069751 RepID=UPI0027B1BA47|nr:glycosyltransferase family 2 protein [Marinimicrobium sp. ABcell2]MDQ2078343.1 glycosyltransferase family 2 protein [Marinimicrobium sp. ABcell2]
MSAPQSASTARDYEVLVCTYNGAEYIVEQVRSILEQDPPPSRVLISDDGSTDQTLALIQTLANDSVIPVEVRQGPGKGVIHNVIEAIQYTRAPYVFLADQDDIWLPGKAALFCKRMNDAGLPHLIFSDAFVWTPETDQRESFWQRDGLVPNNARNPARLMFHNTVQGASACVNRALIELLEWDDRIVMHDWWMALIASSLGRVSIIEEPTLLYRQHESNQLGSLRPESTEERKLSHRRKVATQILRQGLAFEEHYGGKLREPERAFFKRYHGALCGGFLKRTGFLLRYWPIHKTLKLTLALWYMILTAEKQPPV